MERYKIGHGADTAPREGLRLRRKIALDMALQIPVRRHVGNHPVKAAVLRHVFDIGKNFIARGHGIVHSSLKTPRGMSG